MTDIQPSSDFFELLEIVKDHGQIRSEDFVAYTLSLLENAAHLHENKKVMHLHSSGEIEYAEGKLKFIGEENEFKYVKLFL